MTIDFVNCETCKCLCGCGQAFPVFSGNLEYGDGKNFVVFQAAHLSHAGSGPHVWLALRCGAWDSSDERDCWVTMHIWVNDASVITRIEDPETSPFWPTRDDTLRYLRRNEVLNTEGALEWAIARRLDFVRDHQTTAQFLDVPGVLDASNRSQ